MIKFENEEVMGWRHAIRGMRNPMNSWNKSDSKIVNAVLKTRQMAPGVEETYYAACEPYFSAGKNDFELMMKLRNAGTDHRKFMRMITVYVDITAPLYWWKEFDTYKVGTVANSCSTMHKIHEKEFTMEDFSCEKLLYDNDDELCPVEAGLYYKYEPRCVKFFSPVKGLELIVDLLNANRKAFLETKDKRYWWQMIQLLPTSYNQTRTVMLNYEVLANIYKSRKNHKLDEWREFCKWIESLPYSEIITGEKEKTEVQEGENV